MGYYDVALICKNGHVINESMHDNPEFNTKFCNECGAETINTCPRCGAEIRGRYNVEGVFDLTGRTMEAPAYCYNCGKPYPWTEEKMKALEETVNLMDELTQDEKKDFIDSAKDITTDNPRTNLGALKLRNLGKKIGKEIWSVAKDIIVQIGTEAALKSMGLNDGK